MKQRTFLMVGVIGVVALMGLTGLSYADRVQQKRGEGKPSAAASGASSHAELSRAGREAIVKAAVDAAHESVQVDARERDRNKIPRQFWGAAIEKLQPLRVVNDGMNVRVVLAEDSRNEKGLYITNPISSYLIASNDPRFAAFALLSKPEDKAFGELYRYHIRKK